MRFLFLILDFIVFFSLTAFIITIRSVSGEWDFAFFLSNCKVMLPVFILNSILLLIFSFYDLKESYKKHTNYFIETSTAFIVSFVLSSTGIYFGVNLFNIPTPKTNLLLILLIFYIYVFLSRKIYAGLHFYQTRIISLGDSRTLDKIKETLKQDNSYKFVYDFKNVQEIPQTLDTGDIDFLLIANNLLEENNDISTIIFTNFTSKGIYCVTDLFLFENIFSRLSKETLKNINWLLKDISNRHKNLIYPIGKRLFDILFSICLIPVLFPIGIIIYCLILFIDKQNPVFFQERIGFEGKPIQICKFRTMINGTEQFTKIGLFLRKFRLDEIPQIINILDGNLSVVGPRPLQSEDSKLLNNYIPIYNLRTLVKPGLTGWSQLNFKAPCNYSTIQTPVFKNDEQKNEYFKDAFVRLAYDIWYVKNASFLLDIEIMFKTLKRAFVKDSKLTN